MHTKSLVTMFGDVARLQNPLNMLNSAQERYGEIKTYFSKYRNPIGIELEIENVSAPFRIKMERESIYWKYHEDGSLKVAGAEYVTIPVSGQNIDYAIYEMATLSKGYDNFSYSVRTSTHVHVNVSFMNWDELGSFVFLSAYLEPLLYTLCEPDRAGNPYCYPIGSISPTEAFAITEEMKYCGINLAPIRKQMTVEFRQLHGTKDWRLLRRWVQILCKIYYFAKTTPSKEVQLSLRDVIRRKDHQALVKRVLGASIVLFPNLTPCDENLLWVLSAINFMENA